MASKVFANISKTDAKLLTINISKVDHETRFNFDQAELEVGERGITIYAQLTECPDNLSFKVGEKWESVEAKDLPQRVLISLPFADREKVELPYACALRKYVARNFSGNKILIKGELNLEKSPKLAEYLNEEEPEEVKMRVRFFDFKELSADDYTLSAIDKKAAAANPSAGQGGAKAQSQADAIADRLAYLESLSSDEVRAKVAAGYLNLDLLRQDLEIKPALTFSEFMQLVLG